MKLLITGLFFIITTISFSQSGWKLVYENDASGNRLNGSIEELIEVIQAGQEIRIYFNTQQSATDDTFVEHTTPVKFTTIMNSPKGRVVTGQIDPIAGQVPDFELGQVILKENQEWTLIASTTGRNDQMTRNTISGEIVNHSVRNWGTKWFVRKNN